MNELIELLKKLNKKDYTPEILKIIAGYIKNKNYKRSDCKKIIKRIITDEEADSLFDNINVNETYEIEQLKHLLINFNGEKLTIHENYKYKELKYYFENLGLCKVEYPSSYGFQLKMINTTSLILIYILEIKILR